MKQEVLRAIEALPGKVGLYCKDLITGDEIDYHGDWLFRPASVIKLPMFADIVRRVSEGEISFQEKIHIFDKEKIPGCGAVQYFRGDVDLELELLCKLMITISDNTAANVLIRYFGADRLTEGFRRLGLKKSMVQRRFYDWELESQGIQNCLSPREMGWLMEEIYAGRLVNRGASEYMKQVLLEQQIEHKLELLPEGMQAAHKTGEEDGTTNEVALIFAEHPFVFSFFSNETNVRVCNEFIRYATWLLATVTYGEEE